MTVDIKVFSKESIVENIQILFSFIQNMGDFSDLSLDEIFILNDDDDKQPNECSPGHLEEGDSQGEKIQHPLESIIGMDITIFQLSKWLLLEVVDI